MGQSFLEGNTALPRLGFVYDPDSLSWVRMTQPGTTTEAAISDMLADYKISDLDDSSDPEYYGFVKKDGAWYILRIAGGTEFRYASGASGYSAAWTAKAGQSYNLFNVTF